MEDLLVTLHVLTAIVLLGPITVAASLFPRYARAALADGGSDTDRGAAAVLHRITRAYAGPSIVVPGLGVWLAVSQDRTEQAWVVASLVLSVLIGVVLVALVVPGQQKVVAVLRDGGEAPATGPLAAAAGAFSLLWVVVLVLMVYQPG